MLAGQWRDATDSNRQAIVRARFLDILEPVMRQRVNTQFGHETMAVEFQRIVDYVSNLETLQHDKAVAKAAAIPRIETATGTSAEITVTSVEITHEKPGGARPKNAANTKVKLCDHCRGPGHRATVCRQNWASALIATNQGISQTRVPIKRRDLALEIRKREAQDDNSALYVETGGTPHGNAYCYGNA